VAPHKGSLDIGSDADITLVDLNLSRVVNPAKLGSYSDYSLYEGQNLKGWPVQTIVRGNTVMANGKILGQPGYGNYIFRSLTEPKEGALS
jgi:dihydropyrimidinase